MKKHFLLPPSKSVSLFFPFQKQISHWMYGTNISILNFADFHCLPNSRKQMFSFSSQFFLQCKQTNKYTKLIIIPQRGKKYCLAQQEKLLSKNTFVSFSLLFLFFFFCLLTPTKEKRCFEIKMKCHSKFQSII